MFIFNITMKTFIRKLSGSFLIDLYNVGKINSKSIPHIKGHMIQLQHQKNTWNTLILHTTLLINLLCKIPYINSNNTYILL